MSPLLRLWICALFVTLARAGLVNVTVSPDDPRIVYERYSDGWQTGSCGMEACGLHESISFRFSGIALYYVGGPSSSSSAPSINVTLDRTTTQLNLSSSNDNCDSTTSFSQNLDNDEHGVNVTLAGPTKSGSASTDCISFNGFIYTEIDNTSHTTGPPAATSTPNDAQGKQRGSEAVSELPMILGLSIGALALIMLIVALIVYSRRKSKSPLLPAAATVHMLDRSINWKLGRMGHKKRDSMLVTKAGPAKDFVPPPEHDRNWQELR